LFDFMYMKIRALYLSILLAMCVTSLYAQQHLANAMPLKAGGEKGYAPLRIGYTISDIPIGYGYTDQEIYPDIFLYANTGLSKSQGIYVSRFSYVSKEGNLVYQ